MSDATTRDAISTGCGDGSLLTKTKQNKKKNGVDTEPGRGTITIVFVTTGEVIIPQCIRMLSTEKLQQCSNHMKGKVTIERTKGLCLYFSLGV